MSLKTKDQPTIDRKARAVGFCYAAQHPEAMELFPCVVSAALYASGYFTDAEMMTRQDELLAWFKEGFETRRGMKDED